MRNISKKIVIIAVVLVLSMVSASFASYYTSTLSISGNSTQTGSYRDYDSGSMEIDIKFSTLDNPQDTNTMDVSLDRKNLIGYTTIGTTTKDYPDDTNVVSNFNYQNAATYRYYFSTLGYYESGGYASYVGMGNF